MTKTDLEAELYDPVSPQKSESSENAEDGIARLWQARRRAEDQMVPKLSCAHYGLL